MCVTIQVKAVEQYFPVSVVLFIFLVFLLRWEFENENCAVEPVRGLKRLCCIS